VNAAAAGVSRIDIRKLHNEELRDLYVSQLVTRIVKSRRLLWAAKEYEIGATDHT
jgi:hypothetical protein